MQRSIIGYHLDEFDDWVAQLECFHCQHVRHSPPFINRPWVITEEGRVSKLGQPLNCVLCDELYEQGRAMDLNTIINPSRHPLHSPEFRAQCKATLDADGVLVLPNFLRADAVESVRKEGETQQHLAYYTANSHTIYLSPPDPAFADDHPRNRQVNSSKGCITTDQIPQDSALLSLYDAQQFKDFLCAVLGEDALYEYADSLSAVNLHYASEGQELGWHFDNSSFAITLMIQPPEQGGVFEYVRDVRDADRGEMNFELSGKVLDGEVETKSLTMNAGTLVLFRGRNSMHRVTPTIGDKTRMLVVLAYNTEPGLALSESARMTFYGRLG